MKKKIEQIRAAKTWQERADIAANQMPGTSFDRIFEKAKWAKDFETKNVNITRQLHEQLGQWLAWLIQNREIPTLHNMADALAELKRHKPKRDYDLEALFFMTGICPPGWTKTYVKCDPKTGKFMFNMKTGRPIFAAPPGMNDPLAMRDIKKQIAATDPNFSEDTWESRQAARRRTVSAAKRKTPAASADRRRTPDGQPTTNLNLKAGKRESDKAFSTKASKLSNRQKELADHIEAALGVEWANDAGKWIGRIKTAPGKCERVIAEVESAAREGRIKTTPARYAEQIWKEFAP